MHSGYPFIIWPDSNSVCSPYRQQLYTLPVPVKTDTPYYMAYFLSLERTTVLLSPSPYHVYVPILLGHES